MELRIAPITLASLPPDVYRAARREGIGFEPKLPIELFAAYTPDGRLAGFAGVLFNRTTVAWFRNAYTLPEFRRQGVWRALFDYRVAECRRRGKRTVRAGCLPTTVPAFLARGAVIERVGKHATIVRIDL